MSNQLRVRMLRVSDVTEDVLGKRWPKITKDNLELMEYVRTIIEEVKKKGDDALIDFTAKFDGVKLSPDQLQVKQKDIEKAYEKVTKKQIFAIESVKNRIKVFQEALLKRIGFEFEAEGVKIRSCYSPLQRIGCYVPGYQAIYPSSLVMTIGPAKVASVPQVAICSPPRSDGEINPLILVAADICGADEVYRVGGVQAIAALAYGTKTIRPVEKLFGPGNKYILTAKKLVSLDLPIDIPAGPSEIMILASGSADPTLIALDMISQAEHVDGVSILVTTSRNLGKAVLRDLECLAPSLPNKETIVWNLSINGLVLICNDIEEGISFINKYAPEHLEVMTEDAWGAAEKVTSAGLTLIGKYTPVSASDYCLGTIHVLPTEGFSHVHSGLSVYDFIKRFNIAECSKNGLSKIRRNVKVLAESEGLENHGLAVEGRFQNGQM